MDCGDEFLTLPELTARIKFSQQTIYNMISSKRLIKGQHYLKPSRKKILFIWSAIRLWLEDPGHDSPKEAAVPDDGGRAKSRINI
jgi:predicted DNA-binding transcriptional regulator AlpA